MGDLSLKFFGIPEFDKEAEKKLVKDNMDYLKTLSVKEFTFRKKWDEINSCDTSFISNSDQIKAKIWKPSDINNQYSTIDEIENLEPRVIMVDNPAGEQNWLQVRLFCHSAEYEQTPGRYVKILVLDQRDRILGFCAIASDIPSMKCRDEFIGWSKEVRMAREGKGTLLNSAVGTTIAPTQPLGYNFIGGKLIAALLTSKTVRDDWFRRYNNILAGITTTSLYENEKKNQGSQYDGMEWCWRKCGVSAGKVPIKPDESIYKKWHDWIKVNHSVEYSRMMTQKEGVKGPVTSAKMRVLNMIFDNTDIRTQDYNHGFCRGVYRSEFYENSHDLLCGRIKEKDLVLKSRLKKDINGILEWWKPKAVSRYFKLKSEGRLKPDKLFYNGMYGMTYEKAKDRYFKDVGR
jgi:hypothetical protein